MPFFPRLDNDGAVKRIVKRSLFAVAAALVVFLLAGGGYAWLMARAYDASMDKVYGTAPLPLARSTDPAVIARGKHLVTALAACASAGCHGTDLGGGSSLKMGPVATLTGPNITPGGLGAVYTDGELARLIRHGIKKDGRSVTFMPVPDSNWFPDADVVAILSYVRTVPAVDRPNGPVTVGLLGKVLDRREKFAFDVARRIDHDPIEIAPPPSPDAAYGRFVVRTCTGCHGEKLSGGRIPGAPSSLPVPLNLTPDASGLEAWTYDDFVKALRTGTKKNGQKIDAFMPLDATANADDTEIRALWTYLRSIPPAPFGGR